MGVIISSCFTVFPSAAPKSPALEGAPLLGSKSGEKGTISGSLGVGLKAGWLVSCTRHLSLPLPWGWGREYGLGNLASLLYAPGMQSMLNHVEKSHAQLTFF